jgi:Pyruvate/2-oxoacid:ferredoxin oxidoreductase gamma subunit
MTSDIINIIIAGIGGQGVNSLYRVLLRLCSEKNIYCKSSLFKGGAQRLGSIYATLRLFPDANTSYLWYSSQINVHELDILIGLEPWETLRYLPFTGRQTKIWSNTRITPLFVERFLEKKTEDPVEILKQLDNSKIMLDYTALAWQQYQDYRMMNYSMGKAVMEANLLPFTKNDFIRSFMDEIKLEKRIMNIVINETSPDGSGLVPRD